MMNPVILVPTDFSESAVHAMDFAVSLANIVEQEIVLLHVFQWEGNTKQEIHVQLEADIAEKIVSLEDKLLAWGNQWQNKCKMPIKNLSLYGNLSQTIQQVASKKQASFIVMGTRGEQNVWDKLLGTNTLHVVNTAQCPVFVIPKSVDLTPIHKLVYASDYSHSEMVMLSVVLRLANCLHSTADILHVHNDDLFELKEEQSFSNHLRDLVNSHNVESHIYSAKTPLEGIKSYIATHHPELLILAKTERNFLEDLFHHSIIKYFVQEYQIPLLILPNA